MLNNTLAGPDQGSQYINIYNDYGNVDHQMGVTIESNVYRERGIDASDVGQTFTFEFDYLKNPDVINGDGATQTFAFIKVLKRSDFSFATLTQINFDTTAASTTAWATDSIEVTIDPTWDGELFQFGFYSTATNYDDSSRLYDNLSCSAPWQRAAGARPLRAGLRGPRRDEATALGGGRLEGVHQRLQPRRLLRLWLRRLRRAQRRRGLVGDPSASGGAFQGAQAMNIYSDYGNGDHANGMLIDALVFQEQEIGAANVGQTWRMRFDQLQSPPNNVGNDDDEGLHQGPQALGLLLRGAVPERDRHHGHLPERLVLAALDVTIDPAWAGELMQFGFASVATNYEDSGRYYDNIDWAEIANPGIGRVVCLGNPSSTGSGALLTATGSAVAADNDLTLTVDGLPANQMGLFFQSPTGVTVYNPSGSEGHLCIASFEMGRFPMVSNSGAAGSVSTSVDLTAPSRRGPHQRDGWQHAPVPVLGRDIAPPIARRGRAHLELLERRLDHLPVIARARR